MNMSMTANRITVEAMDFAPEPRAFVERRHIIDEIDATSEEEMSSAWRDEIRRRCREVDEGAVELRTVDDAFAEAYAALG